jgi:GNAT superfamily N-acetyltransferase
MGTVFLRGLTRWQAEAEREDLADVHVAAHRAAPGDPPPDRAAFLRRLLDHDVQQPDFDMVLAGDPAPLGWVLGYRADRGTPWWDRFGEVPGPLDELTARRRIFVVTGPLVVPDRRRQGVATALHRRLLFRSRAPLALALLPPDDAAARAAYRSWGWSEAGRLTPAGGEPREVWAALR